MITPTTLPRSPQRSKLPATPASGCVPCCSRTAVRTALHWEALAEAASSADEVLVLDVYGAGEKPIEGISSELIVQRIRELGTPASYHTAESAYEYLQATAQDNDLLLTLGAGDVWRIAAQLSESASSL